MTEYYCYTGDIKNLKPNGWIFQKLYARNYKTYRKDGIIMYVISKMCLEIDNVRSQDQTKVVEFILENIDKPESFWSDEGMYGGKIASWVIQEGKIINRREAVKNKAEWYKKWEEDNDIPYLEDGERIRSKWINAIRELKELGNIELKSIS